MPKRSRIKEESCESIALKKMRLNSGLSQREAAKVVGVPQTHINHTENGRAYIKRDYVRQFINALGYSWKDWNNYLERKESEINMKDKCKLLIDELDNSKLLVVYNFLENYSK